MRVAGYIRVSTEEQAKEGYSLDAQRDKLINFCKSQDWDFVEMYIEEGKSAKDMNRPELQRLLSNAKGGRYEVVLVYRLDRLTRSVMDLYELLQTFEENNIKFKSATEIYDTTTAMGKLFITIVAAMAQWERENLSERVRFGMEELVRSGKWHGGPVPFGYSWDGITMHVVEDEARILRELRRLYMSGEGFGSTAKTLNARGLLRRSNTWSAQSVWYVLDNPFYAGKLRYGEKKKNGKYASRKKEERVEVIWADTGFPTIYAWEEYLEHRERMKRKEFFGYSKKREYWFTGVLRCARCGATLIGRPYNNKKNDGTRSESIVNYICSNRSLRKGCNLPLLRQSVAESLIKEHIRKIILNHGEISAAAEVRNENEIQDERERLNKELKGIAERRKKWQYMFADDLISAEDLRDRRKEEDERELIVKDRLDEIRSHETGASRETSNKLFELPELWNVLNDVDRREMMQTIFKRLVIECKIETGAGAKKGKELPFYIQNVEYN